MRNYINSFFNNLKEKFYSLSSIQKLIVCSIALILLILLVRIVGNIRDKSDIDYKNLNGNDIYLMSSVVDNNTYAIVKNSCDNFISMINGTKYYNREKIEMKDVYKYVVYDDYKKNCSKHKFSKKCQELIEKINSIEGELLPDDIAEYKPNYYIVTYVLNEETYYIGIAVNFETQSYYIWYLE